MTQMRGGVAERSNATDCKSVGETLRWFESSPLHHITFICFWSGEPMKVSGPFLIILATLVIDGIGIGVVFPIMPDLMDRVGAGSTAEGALWGGIMMSAYAAAMFLCGPIIGSLSDAYGRRPILIAALATLTIDYVIMALAETYWVLLLGRILAGVAGATYITATAYISDIARPDERGAAFGMIGAAFGVGFVLGPALGGLASG